MIQVLGFQSPESETENEYHRIEKRTKGENRIEERTKGKIASLLLEVIYHHPPIATSKSTNERRS